jgi:hypothetical protein
MADWSNKMVQLFVTLVLQCQTATQRATTFEHLVEIGDALYGLKNFNGLKELTAALQSSAVDRLHKTKTVLILDCSWSIQSFSRNSKDYAKQ